MEEIELIQAAKNALNSIRIKDNHNFFPTRYYHKSKKRVDTSKPPELPIRNSFNK